jgi:hypothetical protein
MASAIQSTTSGLTVAPPRASRFRAAQPADGLARRRWAGGAMALGAALPLGLAAALTPAEGGLGTHEQLNLPPCSWISMADLPCPTCGMTTAFAHAADGNLPASFMAQPLGFLLALATAMALFLGTYVALTGSLILRHAGRLLTPRAAWAFAALAMLAWGFKVLSYKGLL